MVYAHAIQTIVGTLIFPSSGKTPSPIYTDVISIMAHK